MHICTHRHTRAHAGILTVAWNVPECLMTTHLCPWCPRSSGAGWSSDCGLPPRPYLLGPGPTRPPGAVTKVGEEVRTGNGDNVPSGLSPAAQRSHLLTKHPEPMLPSCCSPPAPLPAPLPGVLGLWPADRTALSLCPPQPLCLPCVLAHCAPHRSYSAALLSLQSPC